MLSPTGCYVRDIPGHNILIPSSQGLKVLSFNFFPYAVTVNTAVTFCSFSENPATSKVILFVALLYAIFSLCILMVSEARHVENPLVARTSPPRTCRGPNVDTRMSGRRYDRDCDESRGNNIARYSRMKREDDGKRGRQGVASSPPGASS